MPAGGHLRDEVFRVPMLLPPVMVLVRRPCDASDGLPMSVVGSVVADASQVVLDRHFEDAPTGAVGLVSGAPSRTPSMSRPTNPRTAPIGTWDGPGPFGFPANAIQRLSTVAFRCSSGRSPWRAAALTPTMTQERPTVGGADVARPVGALAEHQDQVALATDSAMMTREGGQASAASATSLKRRHPPGQIPAENATAETRLCTRANRFGRPSRYSQRR